MEPTNRIVSLGPAAGIAAAWPEQNAAAEGPCLAEGAARRSLQ